MKKKKWLLLALTVLMALSAAGFAGTFAEERALEDGAVRFGTYEGETHSGYNWAPVNGGTDWTPTGIADFNLQASPDHAAIAVFGIDTEGGTRAGNNLLRETMRLRITAAGGAVTDSSNIAAAPVIDGNKCTYTFSVGGARVLWETEVRPAGNNFETAMRVSLSGETDSVKKIDLYIPFDPRMTGTCVLSEEWGNNGDCFAPAIINALDFGQLMLKGDDANGERLACNFFGRRTSKILDFTVNLLDASVRERSIVFAPVYLENPSDSVSEEEWMMRRRGLFSLLQTTPYMLVEDGTPSPGGVLGNNVLSDPVSVMMLKNFQWLSMMGDKAVVEGFDLNSIVKKTLEFWLNERQNPSGIIDYVNYELNTSADSTPSVLLSVWDYWRSTKDSDFLERNIGPIRKAAEYLILRDVDNDGITESEKLGYQKAFGDTGYDTVSSGWKNAYVNILSYKALLGVSELCEETGDSAAAVLYRAYALKMRKAINTVFYDPDTGVYLWWVDYTGKEHNYYNVVVNSLAVNYGIADAIKLDTGIDADGASVMDAVWEKMDEVSYTDGGKTVDLMDEASGNYENLRWGIPNNLEPVPPEYNYATYGDYAFPYYCNGGVFPQDIYDVIQAFYAAGQTARGNIVRDQIFDRQHRGFFANGSGMYMGVVSEPGKAYSIMKWDGSPTDYEGIISRDCSFLASVLFADEDIFSGLRSLTDAMVTVAYDGSVDERIKTVVNAPNPVYQYASLDENKFWAQPMEIDRTNMAEGTGCLTFTMGGGVIAMEIAFPAIDLAEDISKYAIRFSIRSTFSVLDDCQIELTSRGFADDANEYGWSIVPYFDGTGEWKTVTIPFSQCLPVTGGSLRDQHALNFMRFYVSRSGNVAVGDFSFDDFNIVYLSSDNAVTSFGFEEIEQKAQIDNENNVISLTLPQGTDLSSLTPAWQIPAGCTAVLTRGENGEYRSLSVTATDGSVRTYALEIAVKLFTENKVLSAEWGNVVAQIDEENKVIRFTVPADFNLKEADIRLTVSEGASVIGLPADLSEPCSVFVRSQSGALAKYDFAVTVEDAEPVTVQRVFVNGTEAEFTAEGNVVYVVLNASEEDSFTLEIKVSGAEGKQELPYRSGTYVVDVPVSDGKVITYQIVVTVAEEPQQGGCGAGIAGAGAAALLAPCAAAVSIIKKKRDGSAIEKGGKK